MRSSIAFPAISTGIYGYPVDQAAPIAIGAVRGADTKVEVVRFVLFRPADLRGLHGGPGRVNRHGRWLSEYPTPLVAFAPS